MQEYAVPFHWRKFKERYNLIGSKCTHCGKHFYPKRSICPSCRRGGKMEDAKLSGKGKIFTYTVIRVPPSGFKIYSPYVVAIIDLDEGCKLISQVVDVDLDKVEIGMPVKTCFRKIREDNSSGLILYGFKFKPDTGQKAASHIQSDSGEKQSVSSKDAVEKAASPPSKGAVKAALHTF